jgi:ketol-acid reductoisomerase
MKMLSTKETAAAAAALKGTTIAVIGYGNQGQAHARNLRNSGHQVVVGQRPGGPNAALAKRHGFELHTAREAAAKSELVILALPDETMAEVYAAEVAPAMRAGKALGFVHGFNIRFGRITPPKDVDVIMVAPNGTGRLVRLAFEQGHGVAAMVAVHQDATGQARARALAWAAGIGADRAAIIETTFADETETDLFGEQAVLCGGVVEMIRAGFEVLVEAGYPAELAYVGCMHEMKQVMDLIYEEGIAGMRQKISNTAKYGGLTRGQRLVGEQTRAEMRRILEEIRSGRFAEEWGRESAAGGPRLAAMMEAERRHAIEPAGATVREWMKDAMADAAIPHAASRAHHHLNDHAPAR